MFLFENESNVWYSVKNREAGRFTVGCWGEVQLGGLVPGYPKGVPLRSKALKSFLFTEGSFKSENKDHLFDFVVSLCCAKYQAHSLSSVQGIFLLVCIPALSWWNTMIK